MEKIYLPDFIERKASLKIESIAQSNPGIVYKMIWLKG